MALCVLCRDLEVPSRTRTPAESQSLQKPPSLRDDSVRMSTVQCSQDVLSDLYTFSKVVVVNQR